MTSRQLCLVTSAFVCLFATTTSAPAATLTPKPFDAPARTTWRPEGCRSVGSTDAVIGRHNRWRLLHSDIAASDEVSTALAPMFEADWHTENATMHVTVPVFDSDGNLYTVPYLPHENVALISLDPDTGARRWAIAGTGAPAGACAPITLDDPDHPGQDIIYVTLKDRAFAVRPDGSMVWDVPTGLALTGTNTLDSTTGNSYLPQRDAIVGLTTGGDLYLVDRSTGAQILPEPFSMPGEPSPAGAGLALPQSLIDSVEADLSAFIAFPPNSSFQDFLAAVLGNHIEVSNSFAIDATTGRMWIAATAPDGADGTVDGVSSLGSLYGIDVVDGIGGPEIEVACRRDFSGGSASTPALSPDGSRIYVADNDGNVYAIEHDCSVAWSVDVGSQVTGSIAVASDNAEIYASTQARIFKIVDDGASASIAWTADLSNLYQTAAPNQGNFNALLASVSANGIGFLGGVGYPPGTFANIGLLLKVGYGVLDRETGKVRYFADGLDESIAEMNSGPDGAYYNANSPIRRAFSRALFPSQTAPLEGGIRKFAPRRVDLLVRDAVCAAADQAENAQANAAGCPDSAASAQVAIDDLLGQVERMGPVAVTRGEMSAAAWGRISTLVAEAQPATLANQATLLPRACAITAPCAAAPRSGCLAASSSKLVMKRKIDAVPNADQLQWSWSKGAAFGDAEIGDTLDDGDFGVCVYTDADAAPRLVYESGVPASSSWSTKSDAASWKAADTSERGLSQLALKGGEAGKTGVKTKGKGVIWPSGTFSVDAPVVAQLVNLETGACWSSRFDAADVKKSDSRSFLAQDSQ